MEQQSKFELFQKHKIEGLQQIVGGEDRTRVTDSSHPNAPADSDVFRVMGEFGNTTGEIEFSSRGCGDIYLVAHTGLGTPPPDPNDPMGWYLAPPDTNFIFID